MSLPVPEPHAPARLQFEQAKEELAKGKDLYWKSTWVL